MTQESPQNQGVSSEDYVIVWKHKTLGRSGRGTTRYPKERAEALAAELNADYPYCYHIAVRAELLEGRPE